MKRKFQNVIVYFLSIVVLAIASIQIGSEIIMQCSMHTKGYTGNERLYLVEDMGFGLLLMVGLIAEVFIGVVCGFVIGKKINGKLRLYSELH